jgi:hypothetical protein
MELRSLNPKRSETADQSCVLNKSFFLQKKSVISKDKTTSATIQKLQRRAIGRDHHSDWNKDVKDVVANVTSPFQCLLYLNVFVPALSY